MMGQRILDPHAVESAEPETVGLGLLPVTTTFLTTKRTVRTAAKVLASSGPFALAAGEVIAAYEIHMGTTVRGGEPLFELRDGDGTVQEGCIVGDGLIMGSYLHGLFENRCLRRSLVRWLAERRGLELQSEDEPVPSRESEYDRLADCLRRHLDLPAIYKMIGLRR